MKKKSDKSMNVAKKLKKVSDKSKQAASRLLKLVMKKASKKKLVKQAGEVRELGREEKKLTKKLSKRNAPKAMSGKEKVDKTKKKVKVPKVKAVKKEKTQGQGSTKVRKTDKTLPGKKTLPAAKHGTHVSTDFSAVEAIGRIGKMNGAEMIDSFVKGEERKTVKQKANKKKQSLSSKK